MTGTMHRLQVGLQGQDALDTARGHLGCVHAGQQAWAFEEPEPGSVCAAQEVSHLPARKRS